MKSLDVGCGFRDRHKKRGVIGIDLVKGKCDVVADAENLPFHNHVFDKIFLNSILEHLDDPFKCLREVTRISKANAVVNIVIPIEANVWKERMKKLIVGFPVSIPLLYRAMLEYRLHERKDWSPHKFRIKPHHISRFLAIHRTRKIGQGHSWFWLLNKLKIGKHIRVPDDFCALDWQLYARVNSGFWV